MDETTTVSRADLPGDEAMDPENREQTPPVDDSKKAYEAPTLKNFGSVADLTRDLGSGESQPQGDV